MMEGFEDVEASLVADGQAAKAAEPCQRSLDHPAVPPQALAALDAAPGDARLDRSPAQRVASVEVVEIWCGREVVIGQVS